MDDFSKLYDDYVDKLFVFGLRISSDRELVKDCIHDVFVKLFTRHPDLSGIDNINNYLYISLRNRLNDEFRRTMRMCDDEICDANMKLVAEQDEYMQERAEREHTLTECVAGFFDSLSPRQRQIIQLYYVDHLKYPEICSIMGISYQSVRNLMHRSISRLREYTSAVDSSL